MERRLAAILAADVVGYSRLMEADEEATLTTLNAYRHVIDGLIVDHRGRVFGSAGDSVIAEFASPVEAVRCAIAIQLEIEGRDADLPEDRRMRLRIGVNLGDVMAEGDNLFGDGVNIAARLEEIAEPGDVCISAKVHDEVAGKTDGVFIDAGEHRVKNITTPIRVWRWSEAGGVGAPQRSDEALALPDKPSVAVLPFTNMSGDPEQEYFSDGITEDIITELSRFRSLFVVARNSTFHYKGQSPKVQDVGLELGVQYVVEGSIRKAGNRVRITAQLVEATSGNHIWAERYDRDLEDIFALQDEIAETITAQIEPEVGYVERQRAHRKPPQSLNAWDSYQRAMWHLYQFTAQAAEQARTLFHQSISIDPEFAAPYAGLAYQQLYDVMNGFSEDFADSLRQAEDNVRRALGLDSKDALARFTLGRLYCLKCEYDRSLAELQTALRLNPGFAQIYHGIGFTYTVSGQPADAIPYFEKAIQLSPHDPHLTSFTAMRAFAYLTLRQYEKALESAEDSMRQPNAMVWPRLFRTSALGHLGRLGEAAQALAELLDYQSGLTCERVTELMYYHKNPDDLSLFVEGLRKAGLPE